MVRAHVQHNYGCIPGITVQQCASTGTCTDSTVQKRARRPFISIIVGVLLLRRPEYSHNSKVSEA
jgi:hypothetical protein